MANPKTKVSGRTPLSQKKASMTSDLSSDDLDFNMLRLDEDLLAELKKQSLVHRWINAKQFTASGNYHRSGWRPYRSEKRADKGSLDFNYGLDPEGYYRRGDLILAVKKIEMHERWRARIRARTMAASGKNYAEELRERVRDSGVKAQVHDGYDDNDEKRGRPSIDESELE